jgi:hypothetical protein
MAMSPATIRKTLRAMDQLRDLAGIEEQSVDASFMDRLQKLCSAVRYQATSIPWKPPFLDNGDTVRISGLRAARQ